MPIHPRTKHLVLSTPPPPNSHKPPTRHRPPLPRNLHQRPPNNHSLPPNPLLCRPRPHRQRLLHPRLRRPNSLRLHAPGPINRPGPRFPATPSPKQRPHRLPDSLHRWRNAAPLQWGYCFFQDGAFLPSDRCVEEYHLWPAAPTTEDREYRSLASYSDCGSDGWPG